MQTFSPLFQYGNEIGSILLISTLLVFSIPFVLKRFPHWTNRTLQISGILSVIIGFFLIFADDAHNDVYRYLWDGHASAMGLNVYETIPWESYELIIKNEELRIKNLKSEHNGGVQYLEPESQENIYDTSLSQSSGRAQSIVPLQIEYIETLFQKTGFKHYYTTYPPTMQLVLWGSAELFPLSERGLKFIFYLFFLGSLLLIYQLYSHDEEVKKWIPVAFLLPLLLWEGIAAAHSEILFVFFLFLTIFCFQKRWFFLTGVSLALLTWVKFFPAVLGLLFLVGVFLNNGRPQGSAPTFTFIFILGGLLTTILFWIPFSPFDPGHFFDALKLYSSEWRMFPLVFDVVEENFSMQLAQMVQLLGTVGVMLGVLLWNTKPPKSPLLGGLKMQIDEQIFWTLLAYLLLSSTVFSWYFLWIVPLGIVVLARKKWYIFLLGLLITPCIQHFFTVWDSVQHIFYYEENGLGWELKFLFWSFFIGCIVLQIFYSRFFKK